MQSVGIIISLCLSMLFCSPINALESDHKMFYLPQVLFNESLREQRIELEKRKAAEKASIEAYLEEEKAKEKYITISAAGDATLGWYYGQNEWNRFDKVYEKQGYQYFLKNVKSIFEADDLTILNLEGPLTNGGKREDKQFAMRGLPSYTNILTAGNVEAVSLANNHTYDYGAEGYKQTKEALTEANIDYFGGNNIAYTEANGIKVALIGEKGWNNTSSVKESLKKRIEEAKSKADLVIIMFHWGIEREFYPNYAQKDLAYFAIDQGVDLVLGSHPHVIQGLETYKGKNIIYSFGNFCFGGNRNPDDKDTFIYQETFKLTETGIESVESKVIPCSISSEKGINNYQPTPLTEKERDRVMTRLITYSKGFKTSYFQ